MCAPARPRREAWWPTAQPQAPVWRNASHTPRRRRHRAREARNSSAFWVGSARRRPEVSLLGARDGVRAIHADDYAAPRPVTARVLGGVADRVLTRQLIGNLSVHVCQVVHLVREERASARFLRQLAQHELRFAEKLRAAARGVVFAE